VAHRAASKLPNTLDPVAARPHSPSHSPAAKKLRASQCFDSAPQAVYINDQQSAVEQLLYAAEATALQRDHHGMLEEQIRQPGTLVTSYPYQTCEGVQGNNSSSNLNAAPDITAGSAEHNAVLTQTKPETEAYTASESNLDAVLAAATSAFTTVDSAYDALLAITALLVSWNDEADTESNQTMCSVLQETIALLRGAVSPTATAASAEALQATLYAARAAFDELDAICEALLSIIALLTDWKNSAIDSSRGAVINTMQATIAVRLHSLDIPNSCDCMNGCTHRSLRSSAAAAAHATSNSAASTATSHTRSVSTQTDETYTSYEQLQQQISVLTALLEKHNAERGTTNITIQ
jgi:hypothetical protein